ncbi:DUF2971 domain-containing protein [Clostridium botulinum]|nr:DUF2971 domain-containing protein [Clostridium botulinum]
MAEKNIIYHYCSIETFFAIITNKCIRLSDLNKTNDYMEKRWTSKLINDALMKRIKEWEININLYEDYWYDEGIKSHMQYYKREMESVLFESNPVLISCFSQEKDKLSQWRAYGQDGEGISIGFDYNLLKRLGKGKDNIWVKKVLYKEKQQSDLLEDCIEQCLYYMLDLFEKDSIKSTNNFNEYFKEEFDVFCEVLPDYLEQVSCYIKNPAFIEEKEIRIIYDPKLYSPEIISFESSQEKDKYFKDVKEFNGYKINPIKFNVRNDKIIAYADIDFSSEIVNNIIKEIVIGPKSKIKENDIYYLLMAYGYNDSDIFIRRSEATYR